MFRPANHPTRARSPRSARNSRRARGPEPGIGGFLLGRSGLRQGVGHHSSACWRTSSAPERRNVDGRFRDLGLATGARWFYEFHLSASERGRRGRNATGEKEDIAEEVRGEEAIGRSKEDGGQEEDHGAEADHGSKEDHGPQDDGTEEDGRSEVHWAEEDHRAEEDHCAEEDDGAEEDHRAEVHRTEEDHRP